MSAHLLEVVRLRQGMAQRYLLWESRESEPDRYIAIPGSLQLVIAPTLGALLQTAREVGFHLRARPRITEFNLRESRDILAQLKTGQRISRRKCATILDVWNLLDDLDRSVGGSERTNENSGAIEEVYTKIFAGNNLPSVTPPGESYSPALNVVEVETLRSVFRRKQIAISEKYPDLAPLWGGHD